MANWAKHQAELVGLPIAKRAQHSIHFALPDGSFQADFVGAPCHYLDTDNLWKPLDTKLIAVGAEYGAPGLDTRIAADGAVRVNGKAHSQKTGRIGVLDTVRQSFSHIQSFGAGAVFDDTLIRAASNYEQRLRLTETGLREEFIVLSLPNGVGSSATDYICIETAMSELFPDGWLDEFSAEGFQFPNPTAQDASGKRLPARRYAKKIGNAQYVYTGISVADLAGAAYPVTVDPDYAGSTNDAWVGWLNTGNATYATARSTSNEFSSTATIIFVGQTLISANYYMGRGYLKFDTSAIPDDAPITQVNLKLVCTNNYSTTDFDVYIKKYDWASYDPISSGNQGSAYAGCLAATNDSAIWRNTSGISPGIQYASGNLDITWVSKTGNTYYGLISGEDINDSAPTNDEYIYAGSQDDTTSGYRPVLTVVYPAGYQPRGASDSNLFVV